MASSLRQCTKALLVRLVLCFNLVQQSPAELLYVTVRFSHKETSGERTWSHYVPNLRGMKLGTPTSLFKFIQAFFWSLDTKSILGGSSMISAPNLGNLRKMWLCKTSTGSLQDLCATSPCSLDMTSFWMTCPCKIMQDLCNTFAKYLHRSLDDLREILGQNPLKVSVNVARSS